jgi:hypothetical protein
LIVCLFALCQMKSSAIPAFLSHSFFIVVLQFYFSDRCLFAPLPIKLVSSFPFFTCFLRLTWNCLVLNLLESVLDYMNGKVWLAVQLEKMQFLMKIANDIKQCWSDIYGRNTSEFLCIV